MRLDVVQEGGDDAGEVSACEDLVRSHARLRSVGDGSVGTEVGRAIFQRVGAFALAAWLRDGIVSEVGNAAAGGMECVYCGCGDQ